MLTVPVRLSRLALLPWCVLPFARFWSVGFCAIPSSLHVNLRCVSRASSTDPRNRIGYEISTRLLYGFLVAAHTSLVHSETTGALSPESLKSIAHLDKLANKPAHRDGTQYGSRRGATRSFRRHHTSEISSAIVYADAETLLAHAEGAPV